MSNELIKIDFHGDDIFSFKDETTERVFVNIRGICETLGLSFPAQYRKLIADPIYSEGISRCDIATVQGQRESLFLDSELLHGWLFSIQTNRLKPEIREKHLLYKKECFRVLNDYFTKGVAIHHPPLPLPRGDATPEIRQFRELEKQQEITNRRLEWLERQIDYLSAHRGLAQERVADLPSSTRQAKQPARVKPPLEKHPIYICLNGVLSEGKELVDIPCRELMPLLKEYSTKHRVAFPYRSVRILGRNMRQIIAGWNDSQFKVSDRKSKNLWRYSFGQ